MLFIDFKIIRDIINRGDNLKDKQAYKNISALLVKNFPVNFYPRPVNSFAKRICTPIYIGFCVIAL